MTWVMGLLPLALLALSFPIFIVLLATALALLLGFMNVPLTVVPQIFFGSIDKYTLLAVPFFIFAGEIMGQGGISRRIIAWVNSMIGGVRGGMAYTTVGACEFFGAISGSSPATVAAIGRLMYPAMIERGYDRKFALGLITSCGAIASVIPPSIMMILYGAAAEQSVAALFIAGVLPGLLIGVLTAIYIFGRTRGEARSDSAAFSVRSFVRATLDASWSLGTPIVILGGIYFGIFSPTEAAGIACVYGILVTRYIYRELAWADIWKITLSSVYLTSQLLIIVAASGVFSWLLTISGVPQALVAAIGEFAVQPWTVLLGVNVFLLIVGCVIDPVSAIVILTPLLVPLVRSMGIDLVHFGIILTVNLSIGMFTPPFGLNIFTTQALFKVPLSDIYRGVVPFIFVQVIALGFVTYIPGLSLWPVGLFGK